MNKREIEQHIFEEVDAIVKEIGPIPFDKGYPILIKKLWVVADKYDTDGTNAMNIYLAKMEKREKSDE